MNGVLTVLFDLVAYRSAAYLLAAVTWLVCRVSALRPMPLRESVGIVACLTAECEST